MHDDSMPEACPPPPSKPGEGEFYRLAEKHLQVGSVPSKGSWRKPYKGRGPYFQRVDICEAHAFSLFRSLEVIQAARDINPWAAAKALARVSLTAEMGDILESPSDVADTHYDWWTNPYNLVPESVVIEKAKDLR